MSHQYIIDNGGKRIITDEQRMLLYQVANLQENHMWVGDSNGKAQQVPYSADASDLTQDKVWLGVNDVPTETSPEDLPLTDAMSSALDLKREPILQTDHIWYESGELHVLDIPLTNGMSGDLSLKQDNVLASGTIFGPDPLPLTTAMSNALVSKRNDDLSPGNIWVGDAETDPTNLPLTTSFSTLLNLKQDKALQQDYVWIGSGVGVPTLTPANTLPISTDTQAVIDTLQDDVLTEDKIWIGDETNQAIEVSYPPKGFQKDVIWPSYLVAVANSANEVKLYPQRPIYPLTASLDSTLSGTPGNVSVSSEGMITIQNVTAIEEYQIVVTVGELDYVVSVAVATYSTGNIPISSGLYGPIRIGNNYYNGCRGILGEVDGSDYVFSVDLAIVSFYRYEKGYWYWIVKNGSVWEEVKTQIEPKIMVVSGGIIPYESKNIRTLPGPDPGEWKGLHCSYLETGAENVFTTSDWGVGVYLNSPPDYSSHWKCMVSTPDGRYVALKRKGPTLYTFRIGDCKSYSDHDLTVNSSNTRAFFVGYYNNYMQLVASDSTATSSAAVELHGKYLKPTTTIRPLSTTNTVVSPFDGYVTNFWIENNNNNILTSKIITGGGGLIGNYPPGTVQAWALGTFRNNTVTSLLGASMDFRPYYKPLS